MKYERSVLLMTLEQMARIHFFQALLYEPGFFGFMGSFLETVYVYLATRGEEDSNLILNTFLKRFS